jgi:hypothetical protein
MNSQPLGACNRLSCKATTFQPGKPHSSKKRGLRFSHWCLSVRYATLLSSRWQNEFAGRSLAPLDRLNWAERRTLISCVRGSA